MHDIFRRNERTVICAVNYSRGYSIAYRAEVFLRSHLAPSLSISRVARRCGIPPSLPYARDACADGNILRTREIAPRLVILRSFSKRVIRYIKSATGSCVISFYNERSGCSFESASWCRICNRSNLQTR